jgi:hypothetical protein
MEFEVGAIAYGCGVAVRKRLLDDALLLSLSVINGGVRIYGICCT